MESTIKLTRFATRSIELPDVLRQAWAITIQAQGFNIDSEIFVYHIGAANDGISGDRFECVASVNQLTEIPKFAGQTLTKNLSIPYYRSAVLEFVCRTPEEVDYIWDRVQKEVSYLVINYNAAQDLVAVETTSISQELVDNQSFEMNPPQRLQLSYHPAGTATYDVGVQGIAGPDSSLDGWLPASFAPVDWVKPSNAFLYYNMDRDAALQKIWPPKDPFSGQAFTRNGILLPYGIVYTFSKNTIWWLKFDPTTIPEYNRLTGQVQDGNAPWPTDYVSRSSPGVHSPILTVTLFL